MSLKSQNSCASQLYAYYVSDNLDEEGYYDRYDSYADYKP